MPIVTAIARQKRSQNVFSVHVDDHFAFSLSDLELSNSQLRVGTQLTDTELEEWHRQSSDTKAYSQALNFLSIRLRSEAEVSRYLTRKDWASDTIEAVLARLKQYGFVNDAAFAASWIRQRSLLRPRSTRALRFELSKLGLSREIIDLAMQEVGPDEIELVVALIRRRERQYSDRQKLMAYLARQGFGYDKIKSGFARIDEE
jgi:regulatory protein